MCLTLYTLCNPTDFGIAYVGPTILCCFASSVGAESLHILSSLRLFTVCKVGYVNFSLQDYSLAYYENIWGLIGIKYTNISLILKNWQVIYYI